MSVLTKYPDLAFAVYDEANQTIDRKIQRSEAGQEKIGNRVAVMEEMSQARNAGDYEKLIRMEEAHIVADIDRGKNAEPLDHGMLAQAWKAHAEFYGGIQAYDKLHDTPEKYNESYDSYSGKDKDKNGLPKDPFRQFLSSQQARLENLSRSPTLPPGE